MAYNPKMLAELLSKMTKEELIEAGKQLMANQDKFLKSILVKLK